jgi:hypothetical protein
MRTATLLLLLPLAACASGGAGSTATPASQTVTVVGSEGGTSLTMPGNNSSTVRTLTFGMDQVWRALPFVFDSIGIPVGTLDPAKRTIGNSGFKIRSRLKGVPLSRYIDCGNSTQIGPNADAYDVNITMFAELHAADAGGTAVSTTIDIVARPATFAQEYSHCASKGLLETRFFDILKARLERAAR